MLTIITGALAGCFTSSPGPTISRRSPRWPPSDRERGWIAGWTWGVGHASGVVVVRDVAVLLRDVLPPVTHLGVERADRGGGADRDRPVGPAAQHADRIGAARRTARSRTITRTFWPARGGCAASATRTHPSTWESCTGWPGSSHFFGVLPALALPTRTAALLYICAFGVGTVSR
jgi:hypothetical protein